MQSRSRDPAAWGWWLLLASSVVYFFTANAADNDLWGHVFFGRQMLAGHGFPRVDPYAYTTAGQLWVDHEWLSQVLMAVAYRLGGGPGLLGLKFLVAVATVTFMVMSVRRRTSRAYIWGGVSLLAVAVLARGFSIRPQVLTSCGIAALLWLCEVSRRRTAHVLWVLPPVFVVWANLHGGFVLGLGILGLFVAAEQVRRGSWPVEAAAVFGACVVATAVNPYGLRLLTYIWGELSRPHPITEWQPASFDPALGAFFGMFALFVVTLPFLRHWREEGWQTVLALGIGVLAWRHQRHTPVFALCAAAPLAAQMDAAVGWLRRRVQAGLSPISHRLITLALAGLAALQLSFTGWRWHRDGWQVVFDPSEYPVGAVQALQGAGVQANLAVPLDWGEYVLWFCAPRVKVSLDGRFATVFSDQIVDANFEFFSGTNGWRRLIDDYATNAALLPVASASPIRHEPGWERVYADRVAEIYVRSDALPMRALRSSPDSAAARFFP